MYENLTRRRLLAGIGVTGAAALAGCGRAASPAQRPPVGPPGQLAAPPAQPAGPGLRLVAPGATPSLAVLAGQSELLVGQAQRLAFGLATQKNEPITDADLLVRFIAETGTIGQPAQASAHQGMSGSPIYLAHIDVPAPGIGAVVAITADGRQGGEAAVRAVDPSKSVTVAPGGKAISSTTPTTENPLGVARICTRRQGGRYAPCGMHAVSLDQALIIGRPVMLSFSTPQFCFSATCGPNLEIVESARSSREWPGLDWIHVEIYQDGEGRNTMKAFDAWKLQSEPWLFAIGRDGTVVDRIEGPLLPEEVPPLAERLLT